MDSSTHEMEVASESALGGVSFREPRKETRLGLGWLSAVFLIVGAIGSFQLAFLYPALCWLVLGLGFLVGSGLHLGDAWNYPLARRRPAV